MDYYGSFTISTSYYYNGSVLIGMSSPDAMQRFSYDASGKVVSVDYSEDSGSSYTTYYYLRNAQGDIVKLIDGGGGKRKKYLLRTAHGYLDEQCGNVIESILGVDEPTALNLLREEQMRETPMNGRKLIAILIAASVMLLTACEPMIPAIDIITEEPVITVDPTIPAAIQTIDPNTPEPTAAATEEPTAEPTPVPTAEPTAVPTQAPTPTPTPKPTPAPTPTNAPELLPTFDPAHPREQDGSRVIYLTFDDGPCSGTLEVMNILDRFGAKATFFTVGYFVDRHPGIAAEIMRRGNLIACHTYTHDMQQVYASADAFLNEVHRWENAVISACGRLPERVCVRFPGGSTTSSAKPIRDEIFSMLLEGGYRWFDWNSGDNDKWLAGNVYGLPKQEYLMQSYLKSISWFENKPGSQVIFLSHDTDPDTVAVLPRIMQDLVNRGYVFKTLDQHPSWN